MEEGTRRGGERCVGEGEEKEKEEGENEKEEEKRVGVKER